MAISGVQNCIMLERKGRDLSIRDEVPCRANIFQKLEDFLSVIRARFEHLHHTLTQPGTNVGDAFLPGQRVLEGARIGADAHKAEHDDVQESDGFASGQTGLPPCRSPGMKRRLRIVSVEQQVNVGDNHFVRRVRAARENAEKASASSSSTSWFKLAGSIPCRNPIGFGFTRKATRLSGYGLGFNPLRTAALRVSLKPRRERCMASRTNRATSSSRVTVVRMQAS